MASFSGWIESILLIVLFTLLISGVVTNFNFLYGKNNNVNLGINTTQDAFVNAQDSMQGQVTEGEATFTGTYGLNLLSSWSLIKQITKIVWNFISGTFIQTIATEFMGLPPEVALIFRLLYFMSILMIILYVLFRVKI